MSATYYVDEESCAKSSKFCQPYMCVIFDTCKELDTMNEVYLITNRVNGKRYVGITCRGYLERFKEHVHESLSGSTCILHNAIRKYGVANFDVMMLESNISDSDIENKEQEYIKLYNTFYTSGIGYNMTEGGGGMCGYKHTEEVKHRISRSLMGHECSESRNLKIKESMTGREYKDEWRKALSESRLGRFTGEDNPFFGKHHSDDTKSKVSAANTKHRVIQIDKITDEVLQTFNNPKHAGEWVVSNGYSKGAPDTCGGRIGEVCRNANPACTAYGFKWKFEERSID